MIIMQRKDIVVVQLYTGQEVGGDQKWLSHLYPVTDTSKCIMFPYTTRKDVHIHQTTTWAEPAWLTIECVRGYSDSLF